MNAPGSFFFALQRRLVATDAVLAFLLRAVERSVGAGHQLFQSGATHRIGDSDGDARFEGLIEHGERMERDADENTLDGGIGAYDGGLRHQPNDLLTAI